MRSPKAPRRRAVIFRSHGLLQIIQGTLRFPCAGCRQLPFCGLAIWGHLALQAVPSRQVSLNMLSFRLAMKYNEDDDKSKFAERFPELSLFFKAYSLLDSEMICIFPYFCPCEESAREIREILCQSMQEKLPVASSLYLSIARYFIKKSCGIPFSFSC